MSCCGGIYFVYSCLFFVVRCFLYLFFFLMIRRPPRSTQSRSSAASDVYKRQSNGTGNALDNTLYAGDGNNVLDGAGGNDTVSYTLSLIHISEPTRLLSISYAVFCLKKKKKKNTLTHKKRNDIELQPYHQTKKKQHTNEQTT